MAGEFKLTVSVDPQETVLADDGSTETVIIAGEVGRSLGGSSTSAVTNYQNTNAKQGYGGSDAASKQVYYLEAIDSADTTDISAETAATGIYIKNTGYAYSSATALGAALTKSLKIMVGTTLVGLLAPGEAWATKDTNGGINCTGIHVRTVDTDGSNNASAGHLAVEFLVTR